MESLIRSISPSSPASSSKQGKAAHISPQAVDRQRGAHITPLRWLTEAWQGEGIKGWGGGGGENKEEEEEEADRSLWAVTCSQLQCVAYGLTLSRLMQCSQRRAEQLYWRKTRGYAGSEKTHRHFMAAYHPIFSHSPFRNTSSDVSVHYQAVEGAAEFLLIPLAPILPSVLMWKLFNPCSHVSWDLIRVQPLGSLHRHFFCSLLFSLLTSSREPARAGEAAEAEEWGPKGRRMRGPYDTQPEAVSFIFCREK